jgi:hypothetical protein
VRGPFGRGLAEEHDRANQFVAALIGEPAQQVELPPVVGRRQTAPFVPSHGG